MTNRKCMSRLQRPTPETCKTKHAGAVRALHRKKEHCTLQSCWSCRARCADGHGRQGAASMLRRSCDVAALMRCRSGRHARTRALTAYCVRPPAPARTDALTDDIAFWVWTVIVDMPLRKHTACHANYETRQSVVCTCTCCHKGSRNTATSHCTLSIQWPTRWTPLHMYNTYAHGCTCAGA